MDAMESQRLSEPSGSESGPARPGPVASFLRFVVCGGGVGLLSSAAVPLVAAAMPWAVANALVTVVGTLLCTELHALFTFGTGRRPGLRQHAQSSGSALAAYLATTAAMLVLHAVQPAPGMAREQAVYLTASGLAGIGRFLVLRLFVFAERRNGPWSAAIPTPTSVTEGAGRRDVRPLPSTVRRPLAVDVESSIRVSPVTIPGSSELVEPGTVKSAA
jgi:putative flippase GtrA